MKKEKKITFIDIVNKLCKEHNYENEYGLDYFLPDRCNPQEPNPYDDFYSVTKFGGSEGIYTSFYVVREDGHSEYIAAAKTLCETDEAYIKMHELGARVCLELRKRVIETLEVE